MSDPEITAIMITIHCDSTLADSWERLTLDLRKHGAHEEQISAMRAMFYLGALHVFARLERNAVDSDSFYSTMDTLLKELSGDQGMIQQSHHAAGHA